MQKLLIPLLMIISFNVSALLEVKLDGTKPYTVIQEAINSATANDTVLVYPGTYFENIDLSYTTNISLISLEAITNDTTYVSATTINGSLNQNSVIICKGNNTNFFVRGFTITKGTGFQGEVYAVGGGVFVYIGSLTLVNSIVKFNSADKGGGIEVMQRGDINLKGVIIHNNMAYFSGGGLQIASSYSNQPSITFDQENRSSIYDNYSSLGTDLHWNNHWGGNCEVYLNKFTTSEPEFYYASYFDMNGGYLEINYNPYYVFDIQEGVHEQIDADLFVAMGGDDNNSGLTADQPLRSTSKAFQLIKNNPDNPRTVHLPAGDYSNCANGYDNLPITVKSNTTLQGVSAEETIIDGADMKVVMMVGVINASQTGENVTIRNLSLLNRRGCAIRSSSVMNLKIEDIIVDNCNNIGTWDRTLHLGSVAYSSVYMRNVLIQNSISNLFVAAGRIEGIDVVMDNVIVRNNTNTHNSDVGVVGILEIYCNNHLTVKNSQFINNQSAVQNDGGGNFRFHSQSDNLKAVIDNCLFANNNNGNTTRNIHIGGDHLLVNNCTFANNTGGTNYSIMLTASDYIEVYNTIIADESHSKAIYYNGCPIFVNNCLFSCDSDNIFNDNSPYTHTFGENNIYGANSLFVGGNPAMSSYYHLSGDEINGYSPAINAGSEDFSFMPDWYEVSEFDLYGNPRIFDDRVDIGCYEYQGYTVGNNITEITHLLTSSNYPNPFNPETTIEFNNPVQGEVNVNIYNLKGQLVKKLLQDNLSQGVHKVVWNGTDSNEKQVSSGVYFYKINSANKESITKKIILMK